MPEYEVTGIWWGDREPEHFRIHALNVPMGSTFSIDDNVWLVFGTEGTKLWCVPWELGVLPTHLAIKELD